MTGRLLAALGVGALLLAACGDDGADPTPEQAAALDALVDTDLSSDEERCLLDGLIASEIDPLTIVDESLSGDDDAKLLVVAMECVEDLTQIPGFVESFIEGAAEEGVTLSDDQARCAIDSLDDLDPTSAITECLALDDPSGDAGMLALLDDACRNGNEQACDQLYLAAPEGSDEAETGRTCAGRLPDSEGFRCFEELSG